MNAFLFLFFILVKDHVPKISHLLQWYLKMVTLPSFLVSMGDTGGEGRLLLESNYWLHHLVNFRRLVSSSGIQRRGLYQ